MQDSAVTPQWEEENSQDFIDYGKYFVPDRETQINCICEVISPPSEPAYILDLCCGEGLLTRAFDKPSPLFDQLKWLDEAGFTDVDVFWMKAGHAIFSGRKPNPDENKTDLP